MVQKMRKMKDSGIEWIGEIPEGWEVAPIRSCFDEVRTKNTDGQEQNALQFKFGNIISKANFNANTDDYVADTITNYTVVLPDTVMINGLNLNYDFKSLRVALVKEKGVITSAYLAIFPDRKKISPQYATYLFKGYETKMAFHNMGAGIRKTLGYKEFKNQPLLLPSKEEQNKISAYLDSKCSHIDIMLSKIRSSIEEYKKLKQAVITQAVTKGVRGEREMKDSGVAWIGEIPKYWNIGKLKYYWISVESGVSVNAADRPIDNPAQYGVLKTSSVSKFIFNPHEHKQVNNDEYSRVTCPVTADCIIVSRMNTPDLVGACGYVEKTYPNLFLPDRLWQISFKNDVSAKFIWYYLNNKMVRSYISSLSTGTSSTMQNISQGQFGNISVCLPDSNEQKEIADYLDAKCAEIDKLIAKKEQLVKELESYKKSLIYEVVTGKREV